MTETAHKLVMLKPMQTGLSGYARLQDERGRILMQLNARGLTCKSAKVFWYCSGGEVRELGTAIANARGEAYLSVEAPWNRVAPERLQALLVVEDAPTPRPLLIGLCASQSAGSLLDAKNASLSLCEKLARRAETAQPPSGAAAPSPQAATPGERAAPAAHPQTAATQATLKKKEPNGSSTANHPLRKLYSDPPPEIFLPAIDPAPYIMAAGEKREPSPPSENAAPIAAAQPEGVAQAAQAKRPAAGRLLPLRWPQPFAPLEGYFKQLMPCAIFDLPGWRFVCVTQEGEGLWIGRQQRDGLVQRVAYAMRGEPAPGDNRPYQLRRGMDGALYRVLVQRAQA